MGIFNNIFCISESNYLYQTELQFDISIFEQNRKKKTIVYFVRGLRKPSYAALELAKRNVHMYYPVVGVLEMFNEFLHALEVLMPRYFDGARVMYSKMRGKNCTVLLYSVIFIFIFKLEH